VYAHRDGDVRCHSADCPVTDRARVCSGTLAFQGGRSMRVIILLLLLLTIKGTPAVGQMDEDLARRLREAQERLDRANATLQALPPSTNNQFNPDAVRRQDQET